MYEVSRIDKQLLSVVEVTPISLESEERLIICPILQADMVQYSRTNWKLHKTPAQKHHNG